MSRIRIKNENNTAQSVKQKSHKVSNEEPQKAKKKSNNPFDYFNDHPNSAKKSP